MIRSSLVLGCALAPFVAPGPQVSEARVLDFDTLAGWWYAEPEHGGETSPVYLHLERDGAQAVASVTLPAIDVFDAAIGAASIDGDSLVVEAVQFRLGYDAERDVLRGALPADLVPVHEVTAEFVRAPAPPKPSAESWDFPRPAARWARDLGSPIWAALERDPTTGFVLVANDRGLVHALSAETGETAWVFEATGAVRARPAVMGDSVYVSSDAGLLHRLEARSGEEIWQCDIDAGSSPRLPAGDPGTRWDRYASSAVADGERVYAGSRDGHLYALDADTGAVAWRASGGDVVTSTPVMFQDLVVFASFDGVVRAVARSDGTLRWEFATHGAVPGDLVLAGDRILAGSRSYDLFALDAATGAPRWSRYYWFSWIESPPAVDDGVAYTGSSDALRVCALDMASGEFRWKCAVPGWAWPRPALSPELVVAATVGNGRYIGARRGALAAIDRANGGIRWLVLEPLPEKPGDFGFAAAPLVQGELVYAADLAGRVYAFPLDPDEH